MTWVKYLLVFHSDLKQIHWEGRGCDKRRSLHSCKSATSIRCMANDSREVPRATTNDPPIRDIMFGQGSREL
jgi:hypothetical protein